MSDTVKTTVYLDADAYGRLKGIARSQGRTPAALIREAIAEYTQRQDRPTPRLIGVGASEGEGDLSERAEELLEGFGTS